MPRITKKNLENSTPISCIQAKDADEFLELICKRNKLWHAEKSKENFWIFRGQGEKNKSLPLLPSSLRSTSKNRGITKNILQEFEDNNWPLESVAHNISEGWKEKEINILGGKIKIPQNKANRLKEIIKRSVIEMTLLEKFVRTCNKSALYLENTKVAIHHTISASHFEVTLDRIDLLIYAQVERWLTECLKMERIHSTTKNYPPLFSYTHYYPLALGQHSGIPTRLLDWTYNPFVAAFFAAESSRKHKKGEICVYAFNTRHQEESFIYPHSLRIHTNLKHNRFEFLHAQKGIFTEMRGADFYYYKYGKWPSLNEHILVFDDYAQIQKDSYNLKKIKLDAEFAEDLLYKLAQEDISLATLMPTYYHCAEHIMNTPF